MADDLWGDFDQLPTKRKAAPSDDVWADFDTPKTKPRAVAPLGHVTQTAPEPSMLQRAGDAITNFITPSADHVGAIDSYTRGVMGALHRTAGTVNLLGLPAASVVDKVHALVSGQPQTGAQDAYARNMVDPEFQAAQGYDVQPHETQGFGGKVTGAVGALLPDLVAMMATGGESAELGALVKPVVEQSIPRAVARGAGQAIEHSAKASLVPGIKAGVEQAQQHDATGVDALSDVLGGYAKTTATNALPLAAGARPGAGLVEQILTKGAQGAVAMPAVSGTLATLDGQPYAPEQAGVDAVLGSLMGQMGGGEHAPLGAAVDAPRVDPVADRAARAQDALARNADVLGHGPDTDLTAHLPPELIQQAAQVLGHTEPAQSAAALARPDGTPAAQPNPVPADAPPTPIPAEPAGQSTFAQQASAAMRMRAQAEAARTPTTAPAVQPAAERAGSTPAAGDLTRKRAPLNVRMGGQEYPVGSIEDASAKFLQLRNSVGDIGGMRAVELTDESGKPVGYIGHNGEVYEGPRMSNGRAEPVFDPRTPRRYGADDIEGAAQHSDPLTNLSQAQQALSAERAKPQRDPARISALNADVERAQAEATKPTADDALPPRLDIRYGKKRAAVSREELAARDEALQAKSEHYAPHALVEEAQHEEPDHPSEDATPAVIADSIASADKSPRNLKEARGYLLDHVDQAIAKAPEIAPTPLVSEREFGRMTPERQQAYNDARKQMNDAGFVTLDVPGDGKFRVRNNKAALADFRAKVEKSPGFKGRGAAHKPIVERGMTKRDETTYQSTVDLLETQKSAHGIESALEAASRFQGQRDDPSSRAAQDWSAVERKRLKSSPEHATPEQAASPHAAELTDADLTPAEREVKAKASNSAAAREKAANLSRAQGEADASAKGFHDAIAKVLPEQASRVEYVRDYAGLPDELRSGVESRNAQRNGKVQTAAIYDPVSKRVFLVTSVIKSADRAAFNAAHEIAGHDGLRKLLGDQLDPALHVALQNPTVSALADAIMRDRSMDKGQRTLAAEEALAELAAAVRTGDYDHIQSRYGVEVGEGLRASVKASIANFLKRLKALLDDRFGRHVFLDEDVRALLDAAHEASKGEGKPAEASVLESVAHDDETFAPHAEPPVPAVSDLPSRRPGESQEAYTRRVSNAGGEELRTLQSETDKIKSIGRANFKAMLAKQARMGDVADAVFHEYRKLFDSADKAATLRSIDQWETGGTVHDPDARHFFSVMDGMFADRIARLRAAKPEALRDLVENYFPHLWEDSSKATKWYQSNTKRPLDGNKSFLKQRTWGTIREGMDSGLKPVSYNPVDLALLKLQQMDKFITFHEFKNNLKARGWLKQVKAGDKLPEGYATIDSPAFKGSHAFIVKGENGAPDEAASAHWNWAVPESIAADVNNYLSPSLYRFKAWKSLRYVQNVLMSTRLGFSAFHAGFTTTDNLVMHVDVAGRRLLTGDIAGGLQLLVKAPLTTIISPYEGGVLNKAWRGQHVTDPHTAALLTALEEGGATRLQGSQQMDFNNALPGLIRSIRQKSVGGSLKRVLPAIGEASSYLIHQKLVPAQKMAARVMLLKFEIDRLAGKLGKDRGDYAGIIEAMHPDTLKQISGKVVNLVDDRLGQMNYDNQFWNKTAREVAQGLIGAVGWQVGTLRTVTGGIADLRRLWKPEALVAPLDKAGSLTGDMGRVSGRLTYLLSLGLTMGGSAALTQYLLTGQGPDELKDYFFPKTGRKNPDGSAERLQFPSYWMDHYKLATHPLQTAEHKIHPSIGLLMEAINNQDYWGVQLRDEDTPWYEQAAQIGEHIAKGFVPYSLTGQQKLAASDASPVQRAANFVGVTTAPSTVSRSKFQAFLAEKAAASAPQGGRTQDQADHSNAMHAVEDALRRGEEPDMSGLSAKEQKAAQAAAKLSVPAIRFKRLSLEDKFRAFDRATPQERQQYALYHLILGGKRGHLEDAIAKLPAEDQEKMRERITLLQMDPYGLDRDE